MDKDFLDIIKFIITGIIAVLGWLIGHYFTSKRDKINKRRELTIQHLINAYRILTNEVSHREETPERQQKLEQVITEIQLFGSTQQIAMVKQLSQEVALGGEFQLDPLINSLRTNLRKQLKLNDIEGNVTWLRFKM